jgi:hypothetical protein
MIGPFRQMSHCSKRTEQPCNRDENKSGPFGSSGFPEDLAGLQEGRPDAACLGWSRQGLTGSPPLFSPAHDPGRDRSPREAVSAEGTHLERNSI